MLVQFAYTIKLFCVPWFYSRKKDIEFRGILLFCVWVLKPDQSLFVTRVKRTRSVNIPYVKENDEGTIGTRSHVAAFENPGYDISGVNHDDRGNYDDLEPVSFAPFEEVKETGAVSNPVYAEIGMAALSSSQSRITAEENQFPASSAGELPKKEPLTKDKEADYATLIPDNKTQAQEVPRYESLVSKISEAADKEQAKIDIREEVENQDTTISDDRLEEDNSPTAKSEP